MSTEHGRFAAIAAAQMFRFAARIPDQTLVKVVLEYEIQKPNRVELRCGYSRAGAEYRIRGFEKSPTLTTLMAEVEPKIALCLGVLVKYRFIRAHQSEFQVRVMCRVLGVHFSGFYA